MIGVVQGTKQDKTITVVVERRFKHPKYGKYVNKRHKYHAHDEKNEAREGDKVEIASIRPLSKTKRWRMTRIVEAAPERGVDVAAITKAAEAEVGLGAVRSEEPESSEVRAGEPAGSEVRSQEPDSEPERQGEGGSQP